MEWHEFLDCPVSEEMLRQYTGKSVSGTEYFHCDRGFSLAISEGRLRYISFFHAYHEVLPFGLTWDEKNSSVVKRLGEPDKKTSSKALGIEITYLELGISIEFINHDWSDLSNPIRSVILFKSSIKSPFSYPPSCSLCSFCHELASLRCSKCRMFYYCSPSCQLSHWPKHKLQCIPYPLNLNIK